MVNQVTRRGAVALAICAIAPAPALAATPDEAAVATLLLKTFDRPDARLDVDPVVVVGEHAVAGWSQGPMAGRALLRREHGTWRIVLCAGDAIRSPAGLRHVGVPAHAASELSRRLAEAERKLAPERLRAFAGFGDTVFMEGGGHPPAGNKHP